jgi:hypothetical protein
MARRLDVSTNFAQAFVECADFDPDSEWVMNYCWLANTTGRPGLFKPFDLAQEHNIRDIKV